MNYEAVIGLEIHVQLNCATKMFCDCPNRPGDEPNQNTCPICLWIPGAIPQFSQNTLEKATLICLALNCEIQKISAFDQKVYYYPDLPKGFQLSQHHKPLAINGWLEITDEFGLPKKLRIHHIHMEEDVAKLIHETEGRTPISLVDFNRAGAPLVEIVTEPDMRSPFDAMAFLRTLITQIRYTGSSECSLEQGTMRADANISIRLPDSDQLNTKVEVKNMNSIRNIGDAVAFEINRQIDCIKIGKPIVLHTRSWNPEKGVTEAMRSKFSGPCIPDPSVPQIVLTDEWINEMRARLPEMPNQKASRLVKQYALTHEESLLMIGERDLSEYFEAVVSKGILPRIVVYWITKQLLPALKEHGQNFQNTHVTPERFANLLAMLEHDEINADSAKEVLKRLFDSDETPKEIVERWDFKQISESYELEAIVDQVLTANPVAVDNFRNGTTKAIGFLMGQAMQASQGKANPKLIRKIMIKKLS